MAEPEKSPDWERQVLSRLAMSAVKEQRRSRQWSIFFKLLAFIYLFVLLFTAKGWLGAKDGGVVGAGKHTALIDLNGVIAPEQVNADDIVSSLQEAFKDSSTKGVVLRINSPGGSPVQAGVINDEMRRLRASHPDIPLYVVVEDICASGGYYVAAAADKIFVNKASLVGSIGVLMDGFGLTGTMEKLGVQRRLLTAGENKGFLDPFSPVDATQVRYAQQMLNGIHQQFIQVVRQGRGKRLKETPDMFSGLIWTGEDSVRLGLADGYGSAAQVAREVIKAEELVDYTPQKSIAEKFARQFGAATASTLLRASSPFALR